MIPKSGTKKQGENLAHKNKGAMKGLAGKKNNACKRGGEDEEQAWGTVRLRLRSPKIRNAVAVSNHPGLDRECGKGTLFRMRLRQKTYSSKHEKRNAGGGGLEGSGGGRRVGKKKEKSPVN